MRITDYDFSGDFNVTVLTDGTITSEDFATLVRRYTSREVTDTQTKSYEKSINGGVEKAKQIRLEATGD